MYATAQTHSPYFPRGFTYDRCLRISAFMEAFPWANETHMRSWCVNEDINVYSSKDKIRKKTLSRWVVLKIFNTKTYAMQFLRDWILHAYATYANGMKRITVENVEYHYIRERKEASPPIYSGVDDDYYGDKFKYALKQWLKGGEVEYALTDITVVTLRMDRHPDSKGFAWNADAKAGAELRRQYQKQYYELLMQNRYSPMNAKRAKLA